MSEVRIPEKSLQRLRAAYQQFEMLTGVVAEAMGLEPGAVAGINIEQGVFTLSDGEHQLAMPEPEHANGVAV